LIESQGVPYVRLPSRASTHHHGWQESDRRTLAAGVLAGVVSGFAPDILVADTFPAGPHFEAADLLGQIPCRVLIRRTVRPDRADDPEVRSWLESYARIIVPDDPIAVELPPLPVASVSVPPITLLERSDSLSSDKARGALGLPSGKLALLAFGGGADREALERLRSAARCIRLSTRYVPFLALGPLSATRSVEGCSYLSAIPLQRYLPAFDIAVALAGYNTSHELAKSGVRSVLFGSPRPFDDQVARARRFERAGLAVTLEHFNDESLLSAIQRAESLDRPQLPPEGATAAARIILNELLT
jgi:predicted glycosyltransferase